MKNVVPPLCFLLFPFLYSACERTPYVEHKLSFEKVADDCAETQSYFRMNSNFGGERYEFEKCLHAGFTKDELISRRSQDTVYIDFKTPDNQPGDKVFHITLDIDSYPAYRYITIEQDTYALTTQAK